jgi:hypothetical protein
MKSAARNAAKRPDRASEIHDRAEASLRADYAFVVATLRGMHFVVLNFRAQ